MNIKKLRGIFLEVVVMISLVITLVGCIFVLLNPIDSRYKGVIGTEVDKKRELRAETDCVYVGHVCVREVAPLDYNSFDGPTIGGKKVVEEM